MPIVKQLNECNLTLFFRVFSGHDGEGQLRRRHQPQTDPQRIPRQDQVAEGPPR